MTQGAQNDSVAKATLEDPGRESLVYDPSTVDWAVAELVAQPPSQLSRTALYLTCAILVGVVVFASLTRVPTVVSGRGSIRSSEKARPISSEVSGRIAALHATLGAHVKSGDVLVEMAQLLSAEDAKRAEALAATAREIVRSGRSKDTVSKVSAFLGSLSLGGDYLGSELAAVQTSAKALEQALTRLHYTLPEVLRGSLLERSQALAKIQKIKALNAGREFAVDLEQLQGTVARVDAQVRQAEAEAQAQVGSALTSFQTSADAFARAAKLQAEAQRVIAPMDGTVLEVNTAGRGEIVSAGQKLLVLIPEQGVLIADIELSNKDIPGVREGLPVRIKLDALPFQDFGVIQGKVRTVAKDARALEGAGEPTYNVTVDLDKLDLTSGTGHTEQVRLGMALLAEIKTREQSLLRVVLLEVLKLRALFE